MRSFFIGSILSPFLVFSLCLGSYAGDRPELVLQTGHAGPIRTVAISPDGKWLASGSQDSTIKIWDIANGNLLRTLYGHNDKINGLAISPDGHWIVSAAEDNTARIWDVLGGNAARILGGHAEPIASVAFGSGGQQVLTASTDVVKIWDSSTGREIRSVRINEKDRTGRITLGSDGRVFLIGGATPPAGGGAAFFPIGGGGDVFRPLKIIEIASGRELTSIKVDLQNPYATYALSPDSRLLAIRSSQFKDDQNQESIRIMDAASGRELKKITMPGEGTPQATGALAFSTDGKWIAAQAFQESMKASIQIYDVASGKPFRDLSTGGMFIPALNLDVFRVASNPMVFGSNNKLLALGGTSGIQLWDPTSGETRGTLRTHIKGGATSSSANSSDQALAQQYTQQYGMTEEDLSQMSTDASNMMESLNDPASPLSQVMGLGKKMSRAQGLAAGRSFGDKRLQFSPDGRWIVTERQEAVYIWDVSTGTYLSSRSRIVAPVAFSPDGTLFAAMEFDPQNIGKEPVTKDLIIRDTRTQSVRSKTTWTGSNQPEELSFSPDGKSLAVLFNGREVRFFDVDTQKQLRSVLLTEGTAFGTAVFSPNGRYAAYGGEAAETSPFPMAGMVQMGQMSQKDMEKMAKEMSKKMGKDMKKMSENWMQMMQGGGSSQYQIKLFDLQSGQQIRTLPVESPQTQQPQKQQVSLPNTGSEDHRMVFSKNGTLLAVEDSDQGFPAIKIYDMSGGQLVRSIRLSDQQIKPVSTSTVYDLMKVKKARPVFSFTPDGTVLAVNSQQDEYGVNLFEIGSGKLLRKLTHNNRVDAITFSPDGKFLISLVRDGTQMVWDIARGALLVTLVQFPGIQFGTEWLVATPEGLFDGSPAAWGQILWRFSQSTFDVAPVETFFNEYYYPGLLAEIFSGKPPQAPRDVTQLDRRQPRVKLMTAADGKSRDAIVSVEIVEAPPDGAHPSGSGARDVRLFRNGSLVKVWRGDVLQSKNQANLQVQVPIVAGENRFIAYAFNHDNVKSADAEMKINGAESLRRTGTAYVLSIGVNQYENSDFNLKYAVSDARAFSENLSQAQTKLGKFGKVELIHLFDQEATKPNIVAALQKLAGSQPEDAIFLYFAGHGTTDGSRFYMVPHDLGYHNPRSSLNDASMRTIMDHSISDVELEELFENIGAGQTLLVIDACNSGQLLEAAEKRRGPMNSRGLAQLAYEKGMYVLAASQGYQAALEASKLGHGYLTYSLVEEGIKSFSADSLPKDGTVLVREWFDYAAGRVPQMQMEKMVEGRLLKQEVAFVEGEEKIAEVNHRNVQQPRVFYRRESEGQPLVIEKQ